MASVPVVGGSARALGQLGPVRSLATPGRATAALDAAAAWGGAKPSVLVEKKS
jgi:hypothetical protein